MGVSYLSMFRSCSVPVPFLFLVVTHCVLVRHTNGRSLWTPVSTTKIPHDSNRPIIRQSPQLHQTNYPTRHQYLTPVRLPRRPSLGTEFTIVDTR